MAKKRRMIFLVKGSLQVLYLRLIALSMVIPTLFVTLCLYFITFSIMAQQLAIPESIVYNLYPVFYRISLILLIGLPIIFILLFLWAIIISHRMVGPIDRINRDLEKIAKGDLSIRLGVRKHDELAQTVSIINNILDLIERDYKKR